MAAPAFAASIADWAICAGVTGTAGFLPGVSAEPVTAQAIMTLRCMEAPQHGCGDQLRACPALAKSRHRADRNAQNQEYRAPGAPALIQGNAAWANSRQPLPLGILRLGVQAMAEGREPWRPGVSPEPPSNLSPHDFQPLPRSNAAMRHALADASGRRPRILDQVPYPTTFVAKGWLATLCALR
jgi:hypothetical protein